MLLRLKFYSDLKWCWKLLGFWFQCITAIAVGIVVRFFGCHMLPNPCFFVAKFFLQPRSNLVFRLFCLLRELINLKTSNVRIGWREKMVLWGLRVWFFKCIIFLALLCQGKPLDAIQGNNISDHYVNSCKFKICAFFSCVCSHACVCLSRLLYWTAQLGEHDPHADVRCSKERKHRPLGPWTH